MGMLFTLAFPSFSGEGGQLVESFRRRHDLAQSDLVAAHVTLVFGSHVADEDAYLRHVEAVVSASPPIEFASRHAMLGTDEGSAAGLVYLAFDEGHSGLSLLHDRLHRGPLAELLRLDLPYVPHITVGRSSDRAEVKRWCDTWNDARIDLRGRVDRMAVCRLQDGRLAELATFFLRA